jgi:hypothetical protein
VGDLLPFWPGSNRRIDEELEARVDAERERALARIADLVLADLDAERAARELVQDDDLGNTEGEDEHDD